MINIFYIFLELGVSTTSIFGGFKIFSHETLICEEFCIFFFINKKIITTNYYVEKVQNSYLSNDLEKLGKSPQQFSVKKNQRI